MTDLLEKQIFEMEEVDLDDFEKLLEQIETSGQDADGPSVRPDTKLSARQWLMAVLKIDSDIDSLKKDYIPALEERYIRPCRDKIEKLENQKEFLRKGLRDFLDTVEETKVNFPDLATVSAYDTPDKIVYPEKEELKELVATLEEKNSEYIVKTPSIDKDKVKEYFKNNGKVPLNGLIVESGSATVRITKAKKT